MKILLPLLFTVWVAFACQKTETTETVTVADDPPDTVVLNEISYLALGDSYTIGQAVDSLERWPVQLAKKLPQAGYRVNDLKFVAKTGWTTGQLLEALGAGERESTNYDLVSLLIGVNNQFRGLDTADYRVQFRELLQRSIAFAGDDKGRVIVVSIPDYGVTPFAQSMDPARIAREIDDFNAIKKDETLKAGVVFIDITPISRRAKTEPDLIATDGLHPSGQMYAEWVEVVFPVVEELVSD